MQNFNIISFERIKILANQNFSPVHFTSINRVTNFKKHDTIRTSSKKTKFHPKFSSSISKALIIIN